MLWLRCVLWFRLQPHGNLREHFVRNQTTDSKFVFNWASGPGSSNTGFCFDNGALEQVYVDMLREALATQKSNAYVDIRGVNTKCSLMGWKTNSTCVDGIVKGFSKFIVGADGTTTSEWIHTGCNYPAANFEPTDCYCGWQCLKGFVQCGNSCIDPAIAQCASGVPAPKAKRNSIPDCPANSELCPVPFKGFECLDTTTSLEACGKCPFQPGSVDCTILPGVEAVACVDGQCVIEACASGYVLFDRECYLK